MSDTQELDDLLMDDLAGEIHPPSNIDHEAFVCFKSTSAAYLHDAPVMRRIMEKKGHKSTGIAKSITQLSTPSKFFDRFKIAFFIIFVITLSAFFIDVTLILDQKQAADIYKQAGGEMKLLSNHSGNSTATKPALESTFEPENKDGDIQPFKLWSGRNETATKPALESTFEPENKDGDILFDPFKLWSGRDEISFETIKGVLQRADSDSACQNNTFYFPSMDGISSLEQVTAAIHRKLRMGEGKIIVAVLGDSVAAWHQGFVAALESFLVTSPILDFEVEVRNLAKGATGPQFTLYCNELSGDEDLVIYENVRPKETRALIDLASSLKRSGMGVILVGWRGVDYFSFERKLFGFEEAADGLNLPLVNINENSETIRTCLPANADLSRSEQELMYVDEIHPNRLGQITIAIMLGRTIEQAVKQYLPKDIQSDTPSLVALPGKNLLNFDSTCYGRLNCGESEPRMKGMIGCLNVTRTEGFTLEHNLELSKMWWVGTMPGHTIEIQLDEPCTDIVLFQNLRVTNGMVEVLIDGNLPPTIVDGWYEGYSWLPRHRGFLRETVIADGLEPKPHVIKLKVLNMTHSETGTYNFDFTGLACRN